MKYVVVTGGVISGLGKGISISSLGALFKAAGKNVTSIKIVSGSAASSHLSLTYVSVSVAGPLCVAWCSIHRDGNVNPQLTFVWARRPEH